MQHRPFKLFNQTEVSFISDKATSVVLSWSDRWFTDENEIDLEVVPAEEISSYMTECSAEWLIGEYGRYTIATCWTADFIDTIYKKIVNTRTVYNENLRANTHISQKLVNINIISLVEELCEAFYPGKESLSSSTKQPVDFVSDLSATGSGYAFIVISINQQSYLIIAMDLCSVNKSKNKPISSSIPELQPAIGAFGNHTIPVNIEIGTSTIDLKSLTNMSVGDVLTIDTQINSPVTMLVDKEQICTGILGQADGKFSIKIGKRI